MRAIAQPVAAASSPDDAGLRALRASVLAAVALVLGVAGHVLAAGSALPDGRTLVAVWAVLAGLSWLAARREVGFAGLLAGLVVFQLAVHAWLMAPSMAALGGGGEHSGLGGVQHAGALFCGLQPADGASMGHGFSPWLMLAGHGLASLACAWWLRRGEARLWRIGRRAAVAVRRLVGRRTPRAALGGTAFASTGRPAATSEHVLRPLVRGCGWSRRGPPPRGIARTA